MPSLLRTRAQLAQAGQAPSGEAAGKLAGLIRGVLEEEQVAVLEAMRSEVLAAIKQATADLAATGTAQGETIAGSVEAMKAALAQIEERLKGLDRARGIATAQGIDALAARLEAAINRTVDERIADVVEALSIFRSEVIGKLAAPHGKWTMGVARDATGKITSASFTRG